MSVWHSAVDRELQTSGRLGRVRQPYTCKQLTLSNNGIYMLQSFPISLSCPWAINKLEPFSWVRVVPWLCAFYKAAEAWGDCACLHLHGLQLTDMETLPLMHFLFILCTLTYPAGDKICLPLAIKILGFYLLDLSPGISKHFANLLWRERLYSDFLLKQIEEERSEVIWPRFVFELQGLDLYLTSIS